MTGSQARLYLKNYQILTDVFVKSSGFTTKRNVALYSAGAAARHSTGEFRVRPSVQQRSFRGATIMVQARESLVVIKISLPKLEQFYVNHRYPFIKIVFDRQGTIKQSLEF